MSTDALGRAVHLLPAGEHFRRGSTSTPTTTRWAVSSMDGKAHSLLPGDHSPVFQARCGHSLPMGVVAHDHLPGWQWCVPCMVAHLVPPPMVARKTPAGRRLSDAPESALGSQPVPAPAPRSARRSR